MGRIYGKTATAFAREAVQLAIADAGLAMTDIDGLLINSPGDLSLQLQRGLGLRDLKVLADIQAFGSSAGSMIQYAGLAIEHGMAETIVCVFADAPLKDGVGAAAAYSGMRRSFNGFGALGLAAGFGGANPRYAMGARRHMLSYGTTSEQFGAVAVQQRAWAAMNPVAQMREPMTLQDHQDSRWIVEPLRLLDCCLVSNGGVAVVVTSAERARHLRQPPAYVLGWGQAHPGLVQERGSRFGEVSGAVDSGARAFAMAGLTKDDVDVCELYDCYSYTVVVSLEDYGFCAKGEGGAFAASGALGPGGSLPTNTGGGQLSSFYMWGMTPVSEGVLQARGTAGDRQVARHDVVLVSGNGGILDHHSTLLLSPHAEV